MPADDAEFDAYVFMHLLEPGTTIQSVVESFKSKEGVRWAQQFVGSFVVFGAVTVSSFERLQELIAGEYWQAGVRSDWSAADRPSLWGAPHKHSPPYYAIVRVRTAANPRNVLGALDQKMREKIDPLIKEHGEDGWREIFDFRAATVSGKGVDILVEMAAHSIEELKTTILDYIGTTDGVASTDTSFAHAPHTTDSHP